MSVIASIVIDKHLLFADIVIDTRGRRELVARAFTRDDADGIKELYFF